MELANLLHLEAMELNLPDDISKEATIEQLAENYQEQGGIDDLQGVIETLKERESQSTTGVGDQIAMPHAQHAGVKEPAVIFGRSQNGIEWESFDGQPAQLVFMILVPTGGSDEHLQALASLSRILMQDGVKDKLLAADNPQAVRDIIEEYNPDKKSEEEESSEVEEDSSADERVAATSAGVQAEDAASDDVYILGVTACPTGIAHTYMAEEKINAAAKEAGYEVKVETNGQSGVDNRLTDADIERATAIIVAADKKVDMARFDGKPVIIRPVADGINKADQLVEQAAKGNASIYHAGQSSKQDQIAEKESENESFGRQIYKHLMNGISHMLPFIVAGGLLTAISFFWGINSANPSHESFNQIAQTLNVIGGMSFAMMLPMLSGYIGESIADRPGLVVGIMGGIFANPMILTSFVETGVFENAVPSGFLGALIAGFLAGGIIKLLEYGFSWLPKALNGMKPILIYPVFGILIMGALMLFVINGPMGAVQVWLMNMIDSIPRSWSVLLGFVVAAMMSIDMGGPINKAAYVTGTALVTQAQGAGSDVMAAVMLGGMVPPLAIGIAATLNKKYWSPAERSSAYVNYVMGAAFITEGAIPFAAADPFRVIPSLALGSGVAGAISMFFGSVSLVPHGGVFAVLAGGVTQPVAFIFAWLIGGLVSALLLNFFRSRSGQLYED